METIKIIEREHGWIEGMTRALEELTVRAEDESILAEEAYELFALYESFADGRHQDKEERVLLPELLRLTDDDQRKFLGRILADHESERARMGAMRSHLLGALRGDAHSVAEFVRDARAYLDLHREHKQREDDVLLPMAWQLLDANADARIRAGFEEIEPAGDTHGTGEQIQSLCSRLGLWTPATA